MWDVAHLLQALEPEIRALESFRLKILAKRKEGVSAYLLTTGVCVPLALLGMAMAPPFGLILGVLPFLIAAIVIHSKYFGSGKAAYKGEYKVRVIGGLTRTLESGMSYHPDRGLPESWFRSCRLHTGDIDRFSSEDLFEGAIGKTRLWFSEVHAEDKRRRRNSNGSSSTYWVTIFKGLFVVADFHKHFRSEVMVTPDFAESTFGRLGRMFQKLGGNLEQMESPEFEKAFVVRATDPVESRYILTPDMQERMLDLRSRLGDDIRFAFKESHLFITFPNREDWFEPELGRSAHDRGQIAEFLGQMAACFRIVEDLNLNTRIWTKE